MNSVFRQCPGTKSLLRTHWHFSGFVLRHIYVTSLPAVRLQADLFIALKSLSWALYKIYCHEGSSHGSGVA